MTTEDGVSLQAPLEPSSDLSNGSSSGAGKPQIEEWILKEGTRLGSTVATLVYEIDLMLLEARRVLWMAQPSVAGKIDLRWWMDRKSRGREPYVFEWCVRQNGSWFCRRLPVSGLARHAKRAGIFKEGAEQTRAALSEIEKLMQQRKDLLGAYGRARQVLGNKINGAKTLLGKSGEILHAEQRLAEQIRLERGASGGEDIPDRG